MVREHPPLLSFTANDTDIIFSETVRGFLSFVGVVSHLSNLPVSADRVIVSDKDCTANHAPL